MEDSWEARMAERAAQRRAEEPEEIPFNERPPTEQDLMYIQETRDYIKRYGPTKSFGCACVGPQSGCHWCPCRQYREALTLETGWGEPDATITT